MFEGCTIKYNSYTGTDDDVTGTLWKRTELGTGGTQVLFQQN